MELIELHDHPHFPERWRGLITDALEALWEAGNSYQPILPQLRAALSRAEQEGASGTDVVDLCSGGGGPWLRLAREFEEVYGVRLRVCLTDKYPSEDGAKRVRRIAGIAYQREPVDAMQTPRELRGFRTMFSSFHHFGPKDARSVLRDAKNNRRGIGIFEVPSRNVKTLLMVFLTPLLVLALTPRIRPFRWSRLLWTYLVPVVPFVIWFDGVMSCFRAYSREELRNMVQGDLAQGYGWEIGEARGGLLPVTYVIGWPLNDLSESQELGETSKQPREVP